MIEKILLRVPKELKERYVAEAKKKGVTLNALLLQVLWERLKTE